MEFTMRRNVAQTEEEENKACKDAFMKQRFAPLAKGLVLVSLLGKLGGALVIAELEAAGRHVGA
jgi:hypothetical protein